MKRQRKMRESAMRNGHVKKKLWEGSVGAVGVFPSPLERARRKRTRKETRVMDPEKSMRRQRPGELSRTGMFTITPTRMVERKITGSCQEYH